MSIFKKIWYSVFHCNHKWVQGEKFLDEMEPGIDHSSLKPIPMKYMPGFQANCYVCKKCNESMTCIEKIEEVEDDKQTTVKEILNSKDETN